VDLQQYSSKNTMGDADVLAKLSRILETHNISADHDDEDVTLENLLENIGEGGFGVDEDGFERSGRRDLR
jgi:hypothetical protein